MEELKNIGILLAEFTGVGLFVFYAMKGIDNRLDSYMEKGKKRRTIKALVAWLLGPVTGIVLYEMGYVPLLDASSFWGVVGSGLLGGLSTFGSAWKHKQSKKA